VSSRRVWPSPWEFVLRLVRNVTAHYTMLIAAGVAFYCALASIPALVAVVAVYGLVADPQDVQSQVRPLTEALPQEAGDLLVAQLESVTSTPRVGVTVGLALGVIGLTWAVSNALNAIVMAIRIAHERPSPHNWVQGRWFAIKLSVAAILVVSVMLWLVVALPELLAERQLPGGGVVDDVVLYGRWPLVLIVSALSQAILYRLVVGRRYRSVHLVTLGASASTIIWVAGTIGLSMFVSNFTRLESTFGSLSAVVVMLVWFYVTAFAVMIGAEIDGLLDRIMVKERQENTSETPVVSWTPPREGVVADEEPATAV
jgi:membrane protein